VKKNKNNIMQKNFLITALFILCGFFSFAQKDTTVKKKDRKRDIFMQTSMGDMIIRLSDSTPLHRDNFIKLVKMKYYDSLLFHRVIQNFMIQGGDPNSKNAKARQPLGNGGPAYTVPAEFRKSMLHKKGVIAAARQSDSVNQQKASSGSQFYIAQGRVFTEAGLDSLEQGRLEGRIIPEAHRKIYTSIGGIPHLDQNYTVFGEVIKGIEVIDKIAAVTTSKGADRNRPVEDVKIIRAKLIKRKK
jgi:cyclophilin family peptidyl-prolyl cis-trans isomerase